MKKTDVKITGAQTARLKKRGFLDRYDDYPKAMRHGKYAFLIAMLALPIAGFTVFYVVQNISSILLAFREVVGFDYESGREVTRWTFGQFQRVFAALKNADSNFRTSLVNTLIYFVVDTAVLLPLPFLLSYFFYKKLAGYKFFRVAIFLPTIISGVAIVTMFKNIIDADGPIVMWAGKLGVEIPALLYSDRTATPTIIFYTVWFGINSHVLLFQGAFRRIPQEIVESAQLDGVNAVQELWFILIPLLKSTLSTIVILSVSGIFGAGGPILLFTNGLNNTSTVGFWIYQEVKVYGSYNMPAAAGLLFTLINLPIVFGVRKLFSLSEDVEY
ncbi:MAG: sugar ABC transporter permease [Clostridiales bacterium]|jgi:multiple sugar transport system permease protein|nr:sugar ABC transporter permease [Clostridiales bacterium]